MVQCAIIVINTDSLPCLNPGPPLTNFLLRWDRLATIAVYQCPPGYVFNEGGTVRTLGCSTGQWPDLLPVCHGIKFIFHVQSLLSALMLARRLGLLFLLVYTTLQTSVNF